MKYLRVLLAFCLVCFSANAQLPISVRSTNGTAVNLNVSGGYIVANYLGLTNLVPAGAMYDDGTAEGFPVYVITAAPGTVFLSVVTNSGFDQGAINTDFSSSAINGLFTNNSTSFYLWTEGPPSTPVLSLLYNVSTNAIAARYVSGDFIGTIDPSTLVPDANLSANVQLLSNPLNEFAGAGGPPHTLTSSNTSGGSTLTLNSIGTSGYADINLQKNGVLEAAIGVGGSATGIYTNCYFEMYAGLDWYFLNSGSRFGGARGGNGDFVWYQDGTTNTPMFEVFRASNKVMVTNLVVGNITNTASFTLVNTNWISGQRYTNQTGRPILVCGSALLTPALVSGAASLWLVLPGTSITNAATALTASTFNTTGILFPFSITPAFVPNGQAFYFTNMSTGAGNFATTYGGQYMVY